MRLLSFPAADAACRRPHYRVRSQLFRYQLWITDESLCWQRHSLAQTQGFQHPRHLLRITGISVFARCEEDRQRQAFFVFERGGHAAIAQAFRIREGELEAQAVAVAEAGAGRRLLDSTLAVPEAHRPSRTSSRSSSARSPRF